MRSLRSMPASAALVSLVVAVAVVACADPAPSLPVSVPASAAPTPSEAPLTQTPPAETVMPSEPPASDASPSASGPGELPSGEVWAGTYTNSRFSPHVTLTLDGGWHSTILNGFFDVQQRRGTPEVVAVQFANVDGVVDPDGAMVEPADAEEAARIVGANPGLEVLGESEARVGGLTGRVVEVRNTSGAHVSILGVPPGTLGIDSGRALWVAFLDTEDGLLAIMVGGPSEGWEEALAIAEPVLESVVVEP